MSELYRRICAGKLEAKDSVDPDSITHKNDGAWYDAVKEARGRGVPISSFGDTADKIVLHPGHLGYDFDYFWGRDHWSNDDCWGENVLNEDRVMVNQILLEIARELTEQKYVVWIVFPSGNNKGYLSTTIVDEKDWDDLTIDSASMVLFVFGWSPVPGDK